MLQKIFLASVIFVSLFFPVLTHAQSSNGSVLPVINAEEFVQVGKKIIFDASRSTIPQGLEISSYRWDFGDGFFEIGEEVVHQYDQVGTYDVTLTLLYGNNESKINKSIFVYDRRALLIVDAKKLEEINLITKQAQESGIALKVLSPQGPEADFLNEDSLVKLISEQSQFISESDIILLYTKSLRGLQAFTRYWQNLDDPDKELVKHKFFAVITDGNLNINSHAVFQSFKIIDPSFILLTRAEAFGPILSTLETKNIETELSARGIEYHRIDAKSGKSDFYILSRLVTFFIERGLSADSVYLILVVPFLACIVIFFRHVIGVSTFGVYTPVIIAVIFYIIGPLFGISSFFFAVITSYIAKYIFDKFELLYLPKVALNLSFSVLSFLILIFIMIWFGKTASLSVAIFPMLVMSTLSEKFMAAKLEEGLHNAVVGVVQTLAVIVISYYIMVWSAFNNLLVSWPEVILIPLLGTLLLGKFSGLRISEYFRFRSLFSDHTEE